MTEAKDCPSTLPTTLHETGDLSWGGEFRFWRYYVSQYNYDTDRRQENSYTYLSARGMAEYAYSDAIYAGAAVVFRNAEYAADDFVCEFCSDGFQVNVRQAWLDYAGDAFLLHVGRDMLAAGNGMVLDDFFDQVSVEFDVGDVSLWGGGGVLANDIAREAASCQRGAVYKYYPYWKQTTRADWGDHRIAFVEAGAPFLPRHYHKFLVLYTDSRIDDEQDAWIGYLYLNGTLPGGVKYFTELAWQYYCFCNIKVKDITASI